MTVSAIPANDPAAEALLAGRAIGPTLAAPPVPVAPTTSTATPAPTATPTPANALAGTRLLAVGVAATGICTFLYLATASHVLDKEAYSRISLGWSILFVIASVIYRPIEQLLSRTIADRAARGQTESSILRTPALIQAAFALTFIVVALALRDQLQNGVFDGSQVSYWVLLSAVTFYAGSYFARGWLAGSRYFALYGALMLFESVSRLCFALAAAIGLTHGEGAIAIGMAAAPLISLCVIPSALRTLHARDRRHQVVAAGGAPAGAPPAPAFPSAASATVPPVDTAVAPAPDPAGDLSLRHGSRFAASVVAIQLAEQTLINGGVLVIAAASGFELSSGLAGFAFNVFLVVRAPLQLFQAVQTAILPHLTGMQARSSHAAFARTVRLTVVTALAFGAVVALALLAVGPLAMRLAVGDHGFQYGRLGLALVGLGVGVHLVCGTLNQALLARGRERFAAGAWLLAAAAFILLAASPWTRDQLLRVQAGYLIATSLLATALYAGYRLAPRTLAVSR